MQDGVAALLTINIEILTKEDELRRARIINRSIKIGAVLLPTFLVSWYALNWATWGKVDLAPLNVPLAVVLAAAIFGTIALVGTYDVPEPLWKIEMDLTALREKKRLKASELQLDWQQRRSAYKEESERDVTALRAASARYRRIHNLLQSVVIVGSLATTTVSSLSLGAFDIRWATVGFSVSVGLAAGFSGYFKFRERSYYLQVTADSIEQEWTAVELGIGRYRNLSESDALAEFVTEVHRLRTEQQKREQNLDQPSEDRTD